MPRGLRLCPLTEGLAARRPLYPVIGLAQGAGLGLREGRALWAQEQHAQRLPPLHLVAHLRALGVGLYM